MPEDYLVQRIQALDVVLRWTKPDDTRPAPLGELATYVAARQLASLLTAELLNRAGFLVAIPRWKSENKTHAPRLADDLWRDMRTFVNLRAEDAVRLLGQTHVQRALLQEWRSKMRASLDDDSAMRSLLVAQRSAGPESASTVEEELGALRTQITAQLAKLDEFEAAAIGGKTSD